MLKAKNPGNGKSKHSLHLERLETRRLLVVEITEFLASNENGDYLDEDGDASDWVEVFNSGPDTVDLNGWHLTDDPDQLDRWTFPSHTLAADDYVVVFASGKDRAVSGSQLHTDFKLRRRGEYLALVRPDSVSIATEFGTADTDYVEQLSDVSYGPTQSSAPIQSGNFYMTEATPGAANLPGFLGFIDDTSFSADRGFYSANDLLPGRPLAGGVVISASDDAPASAQVLYTTDGSVPTEDNPNASLYSAPIVVATTTTLRAAAFADQYIPSNVDTHSYIFPADVLSQDGSGLPQLTQTDYEMDPDVVNDPRFASLEDDLKSLPSVSFVAPVEDVFGPDGIIENPTRLGRDWEREVSVELIYPDGTAGFQENAGLRIQGAGSRARPFSKKGFQLFFRGEYGAKQLEYPFFGEGRADTFDRIAFRGNFFDSWTFNQAGTIGGDCCGYDQVLLLRDQFGHETHAEMGALTIDGNWVHLYINGQYWGLYNTIERPDEQFAESYLGGSAADYDVLKQRPRGQANGSPPEVVNGDRVAWDELMTLIRGEIETGEVYQQVQNRLDVEQFVDYVLLNIFGGNFDWPHNNWYAIRERTENSKWTFVSWDTENFIFSVAADRTEFNTDNSPGIIYSRLRRNAEFRLLFADRVHRHLFNDGTLTPARNIERFQSIVDEIAAGMNPESARWGDTHVHPPRNTVDTWRPVVEEKVNNYFPQRTDIVLGQLLKDGLYTEVDAPEYFVNDQRRHGGSISATDQITLVQLSSAFVDTVLVDEGAAVTAYIPGVDEYATPVWTDPAFDPVSDPLWSSAAINGTTGIGYDADGDYLPWINTDVSAMEDNSGSVLTRIEFTHDDTDAFDRLQLLVRYDDAFVAYLNGVEVARTTNIRTQLPPQAARARNHAAGEDFDVFDISNFKELLVEGTNVLAIQAINVSVGSNDLVMVPKLIGGILDLDVVNDSILFTADGSDPRDPATNLPRTNAQQFVGGVSLEGGGTIKSRVFEDGVWSALSEATFDTTARAGDLNQDRVVDVADIDLLAAGIQQGLHQLDLTSDGVVDESDLTHLVKTIVGTSFGDSNLDGRFDPTDLLDAFSAGEYNDGIDGNSTWAEGDWNADGDFDPEDLLFAFADGGYDAGPPVVAGDSVGAIAAALADPPLANRDRLHGRRRDLTSGQDDTSDESARGRPVIVDILFSQRVQTRDWTTDSTFVTPTHRVESETMEKLRSPLSQIQVGET